MSVFGWLKNTFLPSEEVSAARRLDTFGTESKLVAGTVIVGAAVAAIAAPIAIGAAGGAKAVGGKVLSYVAANPLKTLLVGSVAAPVITGTVVREPKTVTRAAGGYVNFESNLYSLAKEPSRENAEKLFSENPIISTAAGAGLLYVAGKGAVGAASLVSNARTAAAIGNAAEDQSEKIADAIQTGFNNLPTSTTSGLPAVVPPNSGIATSTAESQPITRETTVLGREPTKTYKRRKSRALARPVPPVRLQILNQNTYIEA